MDILTLRSAEAAWHTTNGATRLCLAAAVLMIAGGAAAARTVTSANVQHAGASGEFVSVALGDSGQDGDGTADDGVFTARVPAYADELPRYLFTYELTVVEAPAVDVGTTPTTLFINELMASNDGTIADPQGDEDDWIELLNAGSEAIDLTGMYLSDKSSRPLKWQFPADTSIAAGGYLLVWADDDAGDSPGLHASFKLSAGGESVVLSDIDARDNALIDSVDFPALAADVSYGRTPEATGPFGVLAVASPGGATPVIPEVAIDADGAVTEGGRATFNVTAVPAPSADLVVNLVVTQGAGQAYLPASPPTSVTVAAGATEAALGVEIPNDAVDEPHGVLTATLASGAGYTLGSVASASVTVRDDDPGPSDGGVVVNELMASNGGTALDPQGEDDDWIELYNTAARQIDLSGMYLSDNRDKPKKWSFPAGTVIQRNGYLLVWADEDTDDSPGLHADFKLSAGGESVVLSDTDDNGNAVIDAVDFPALARDASYAREPEGTGPFRVVDAPSPGVAALPPGAKLSGLTLSGIDIGTFAGDTFLYAASVASEVVVTTVSATANDAASTVTILPADADAETRGHQVQLVVGATVVAVTVTANGGQSGTYGVTVTRAPPPPVATLTAVTGAVAEGAGAAFTVMLDRAADAALTVAVSVTQDGEVLASVPAGSVSIASGETRATLEVATDDDSVVEADGSLTATLTAGTGYTVGEPAAATVTVSDDDAAAFAVTAAPDLIEEGGSATVTVSITNGTTFAEERTVSLSVSGLAAGSYTLEPAAAVLAAGTTSVTATFTALADDAEERPKTARIAATVDGAEVGVAELSVEEPAPAPGIAGVPQVGGVLEAVLDDTVADSATAWQWLGDGAPIAGATQERYAPVETDVGAALSVRVRARGRERTSTTTVPVWPAPGNPPLAAAEEELLGTTLTLGSRTFGVGVAGFSRLPGREFGSVEDAAFAAGDRELTLFMMNKWGNLGLATTPALPDADGLTAYWDGYPIRPLAAREVDDRPVWIGRTPQPPEEFERYVTGASDGVRVAVSLRRPLPAATLSALSGAVPEGSAATFEVALDRAAWSALTVSLSVIPDGAVLAEAAPVSVAFAAGESRATVTLETVDDAVIEGDGAVAVTLVAGDGYVLGEETSASVTVEEDDEAVFAVSAAAGEIDEGGTTTLTVEVANGKTFAADQSIALSVSGSASPSDYRLAPATLALPVGDSSAAATLTAVRDVAAEPAETVTVTATHDGSAVGSATVTIRANEAVVSTATVSAVSGTVTEGAPLTFEVALDTAALQPLTVAATVSETRAVLSGAVPAAVEFAVGERTRALVLATSDDAVVETDSTVTVALGPGDGYLLGSEASSSATVADNDAAIFEVSASPEEIDEGGSSTLTVSIAKGVTFAADQSIALSVSGSASAADYGLAPETLTLAAGAGSVEATLTAVDDVDEESAETATVTATHSGTAVGSVTLTIRASDIPSDDASLASLVLSDVDIGTFSPEATDYAAEVPSELSSTTVTVAANDAGAVVEIADTVGSTLGETRTVRLEEGDNAITVTVAAEDGATTRTYRVAVTRAYAAAWGEPLPQRDIDLGAGAGPTGLWSDGETLWVVRDWRSGTVRAYDLDDGSLLAERGFELTGGSGFPSGVWSDGTTLWVSDFYGGVTAHRLSDGARLPAEDVDEAVLAAAGNSGPSGLWSDGATLWVADDRSWKAFAYRLSDKSRLASKEVDFSDGDPVSPWGLWSDGETLLVADPRRGMLYGYRMSDGARQTERTVNLSAVGVRIPMGLWSDGRVLWVASELETTVHAYAVPGLRRAAAGTFPVRVSSRAPRVPGGAQGGRSVGIPDAALRARIAAALGKPADAALGERELAALTALDARAAGVTDLTGLEYAVHLTALDLGDNALVDLRTLADLPALTVLNLDRTGADPWSLARLTGLRRLSLRGNGLGDVQALRSLTALRVLDLGANRVEDLRPLGGLSALQALRADGNAVDDASALRAMGLRILDLDGDAAAGGLP